MRPSAPVRLLLLALPHLNARRILSPTMQLPGFANPFEKIAEAAEKAAADLMGPTEGPISLAKANFAQPVWDGPQLRELNGTARLCHRQFSERRGV